VAVVNVPMRSRSVQHSMEERPPIRPDADILAALFVIGLSAALPVTVLYWLMRPTTVPSPGISAYRPPRPDPSLIPRETRDAYALSIAAAKRENELLHADAQSAFAAARDAIPAAEVSDQISTRQQKRQRSARTQSRRQNQSIPVHAPIPPSNSWAGDHSFATWYR
jgi:hypothetical protein